MCKNNDGMNYFKKTAVQAIMGSETQQRLVIASAQFLLFSVFWQGSRLSGLGFSNVQHE